MTDTDTTDTDDGPPLQRSRPRPLNDPPDPPKPTKVRGDGASTPNSFDGAWRDLTWADISRFDNPYGGAGGLRGLRARRVARERSNHEE